MTYRNLSKPSQACGRFSWPADGMSVFGSVHEPIKTPAYLLYVHLATALAPAPPSPLYALLFDRLDVPAAGARGFATLGPFLVPGSTAVWAEPVTEWHGMTPDAATNNERGRPPSAGWPLDNGLVIVASSTPVIYTPGPQDVLSVIVRGQL